MKKIKVCHLTSVHPAFDTRIFYKEAKTLVKAGYDVTLIAQHDKDEIVDGVKIVALLELRNRIEILLKSLKKFDYFFKKMKNIKNLREVRIYQLKLWLRKFS